MKDDFVRAFEQMGMKRERTKKAKNGGVDLEEAKTSEEITVPKKKQAPDERPLSPKSKRQMMWELEDSCSDSQASSVLLQKEDTQKEKRQAVPESASDSDSDDDEFNATLLCLICNESFDSPEASQDHMLCTAHESFEMVGHDTYEEEMKESLFAFEREPEKDDWEVMVQREFKIIF